MSDAVLKDIINFVTMKKPKNAGIKFKFEPSLLGLRS